MIIIKKVKTIDIDIAIPGDARVKDKELEKIEKYQLLSKEISKLWKLKKVTVVPVVIRALGADDDDLFINHFCSRWLNYSEGQQYIYTQENGSIITY